MMSDLSEPIPQLSHSMLVSALKEFLGEQYNSNFFFSLGTEEAAILMSVKNSKGEEEKLLLMACVTEGDKRPLRYSDTLDDLEEDENYDGIEVEGRNV